MAYVKNINGYDIKDAEARDQIAALKEYVDRPLGRWIFVGDSYNVDYRTDASGIGWGSRIIQETGLTDSYSFSAGSTAFGKSGSLNFNYVLSQNIASVSDPETITDILVGGGYNEWEQTNDSINNGIRSFVQYAKSVCSNARVHIAFIGRSKIADRNLQFPRVFKRYQYGAGFNGASYVANSEAIIQDTNMIESDGIHPTNEGLAQIASALSSYVVYGNCSWYSRVVAGRLTPAGDFTINDTARLYSSTHDSVQTALLINLRLTATGDSFTISGDDYTDIAEISRCAIMGADDLFHTFKSHVYCELPGSSGSFQTALLSFKIYRKSSDNKLYLAARAIPMGTFAAWESITARIIYMYKDPTAAAFDTMFGTE